MTNTLEVIETISQIVAKYGFDGAKDDEGEPIKIGLKREEGNPLIDSRIIDGFGVKFYGDKMCITYQSIISLKDVHKKNFESDIENMINDIVKFFRKEYSSVVGKSLSLTATDKPISVLVQSVSHVRSWVQAEKEYKIGGIDAIPFDDGNEPELRDAVKKWLELRGKGSPKPENVLITPKDNQVPEPYKKKGD